MPEEPTFADVLLSAVRAFDYAGVDTPQMDARLLLCHAAGATHSELISRMQEPVSGAIQSVFASFVVLDFLAWCCFLIYWAVEFQQDQRETITLSLKP